MSDIVRTPIGNYMQTCLYVGATPRPINFTTLNQLFGVNHNAPINNNDRLTMRYAHIGIGGHESYVNDAGISTTRKLKHKSTDAGLFKPIPFAIRTLDNDLSEVERRLYCCVEDRVLLGVLRRLYWVRRMDTSTMSVNLEYIAKINGVEQTPVPYVPLESGLRPTPTPGSAGEVNPVLADKIVTTAPMALSFTTPQIQDLLNAAAIMYGDESSAVISEVALCTGIERSMQIPTANGGMVTQPEAIHLQVNTFASTKLEMQFASRNAGVDIDVGSSVIVG